MLPVTGPFEVTYSSSDIVYGRGSIRQLGRDLGNRDLERALVVSGSNVGANEDLMNPLKRSLEDQLIAVFDETTPEKQIETAYDGIQLLRELDIDVIVAVGGGSSLDTARLMNVLDVDGRTLEDLRQEIESTGTVSPASVAGPLRSLVVVPTTFAGADLSGGGSLEIFDRDDSPDGDVHRIGVAQRELAWPDLLYYDVDLFETTPMGALAGSAMNGFNKGIETIYSGTPSAFSDAAAIHGLRHLSAGLPDLPDADAFERAVSGIMLVQYEREISVVHAFGHGFTYHYPVQQGVVHGILVPHVLESVFERVDARRDLIAEGLGIETSGRSSDAIGTAIVEEVAAVRDSLGLPSRLHELDPVEQADFRKISEFIATDGPMDATPDGYDPDPSTIENTLHAAW